MQTRRDKPRASDIALRERRFNNLACNIMFVEHFYEEYCAYGLDVDDLIEKYPESKTLKVLGRFLALQTADGMRRWLKINWPRLTEMIKHWEPHDGTMDIS